MPELPEVETIRRDLAGVLPGLTIRGIKVYDSRVLKSPVKTFSSHILGRRIAGVARRGKTLILEFEKNGFLVVQLKMTGQMIYGTNLSKEEKSRDTKIRFHLSNGQYLNYNDQRLFGRLQYVEALSQVAFLEKIGPEPLSAEFTAHWLKGQMKNRRAPVKTLLMNQNFIAGIGNIYASEILFQAGIDPRKEACLLTGGKVQRLYLAIGRILKEAIRCRGSSIRNYRDSAGNRGRFVNRIKVYAREHKQCLVCRQPIIRIIQSGRSTFYCRRCQN